MSGTLILCFNPLLDRDGSVSGILVQGVRMLLRGPWRIVRSLWTARAWTMRPAFQGVGFLVLRPAFR